MGKKPTGGNAFDELASKIVHVPKRELDRAVKRWKKHRKVKKQK